jgi:hypothetical protein
LEHLHEIDIKKLNAGDTTGMEEIADVLGIYNND